jgi:hypothetical protein
MPESETKQRLTKCSATMHDGKPCGRKPYDDEGLCICHSEKPDKDAAAFRHEIEAMLEPKDYDFSEFVFPCAAEFSGVVFDGAVRFAGATFRGDADFTGVTFQRWADFAGATFLDEANFQEVTFHGEADFTATTFLRDTHFARATFEREAHFRGYEYNRVFSRQADSDFRSAGLHQSERMVFQHVFLGRTRFLEADLRKVDFTDVEWVRCSGGRLAVWDELAPEEQGIEKDYALIGKLIAN